MPDGRLRARITMPMTTMRTLVTVRYASAVPNRGAPTASRMRPPPGEIPVTLRQHDLVPLQKIILLGVPQNRPLLLLPAVWHAACDRQALPPAEPRVVAQRQHDPGGAGDPADGVREDDFNQRDHDADQAEHAHDRHLDGGAAAGPSPAHVQ